jgi:hypothetical protein
MNRRASERLSACLLVRRLCVGAPACRVFRSLDTVRNESAVLQGFLSAHQLVQFFQLAPLPSRNKVFDPTAALLSEAAKRRRSCLLLKELQHRLRIPTIIPFGFGHRRLEERPFCGSWRSASFSL